MAEVTQLKSGSWLVTWEVEGLMERRPTSASTTFTCMDVVYKLIFTQDLYLCKIKLESFLFSKGVRGKFYPKAVSALLEGQLQEMEEYFRGCWGPAQWTINNITSRPRSVYDSKILIFQLLIEFPPSSSSETVYSKGQRTLLNNLSNLFEQRFTADVTFVVQGKEIKAHSTLVTLASPVFAAMFEQHFEESQSKRVLIDDIEPAVFEEVLKYVYTGVSHKLNSKYLFQAADKYQINSLKEDCENELISHLVLESDFTHLISFVSRRRDGLLESTCLTGEALNILLLAHLHSAPKLLEAALEVLLKLKQDVWANPKWKELSKDYPDLFFLAAQRLSNHCNTCRD